MRIVSPRDGRHSPLAPTGRIHFVDRPSGEIQARTRFRDYDGRVRMVTKVGRSRASAERPLKTELSNRQAVGGGGAVAAATRMSVLADTWLEADHGWSTGTQRTYRSVITKQVEPAFGQLCIREVTPGVVSRALSAIAKSSGPGAAKTARACLSAEMSRLRELLRSSDRANGLDLPDLVAWMLATGCRIGEAPTLRHGTNGDGKRILDLWWATDSLC